MNILHKNNIGRVCYNKLLWYLALVALIFAISCKQSSNGSGQEHIISNEITITVEGDDGIIINKLNTIRVKKDSSWKEIKHEVIEKATPKRDMEIREWRVKDVIGQVISEDKIFEKDTIVFAVSKVKDEPPAKQIIITIEVDEGYTFKKTHKPCTVEAQKGSSWLSIKVKAEAKIELKQGYKQDSWKLGGKNGNRLEDAFVFNENAIIFATSIKEKISQYKVEHWKENIENDDYTKQEEDINTGIVGTNTLAEAKQYEGFKAQSFSQALIKEDGTTIIQIKYKRNITTLILDLSGGESSTLLEDGEGGKKLLKGKFEAIVEVKDLKKENNNFEKWEPKLPVSFPATSTTTTYTAKWIPKNIVYRVNIAGDERVEVLSPNYIDISLGTSKTIEEIRSEIEAKISLKAGWSAEDYGFYDFRIGGEDGKELLDSSQISQNVIVYVRTNYKRFRMNGTNLEGYDGQKPRGRIFLPKETESIGNNAFFSCEGLTAVDLSQSVKLKEIQISTFSKCNKLKSVNLSGCSELTTIGYNAFDRCSSLESIDLSPCVKLRVIRKHAFWGCSKLKSVNLNACSELTSIGGYAFLECASLKSVDLTSCSNLSAIGSGTFDGCMNLESIDLSSCPKLMSINDVAFKRCSKLKNVNLTGCAELTYLGVKVFQECINLEGLDLSSCTKLKTIPYYTFVACSKAEIKLPVSIAKIEPQAFGKGEAEYCKKVLVPNEEIKELVKDSGYPEDRIMVY